MGPRSASSEDNLCGIRCPTFRDCLTHPPVEPCIEERENSEGEGSELLVLRGDRTLVNILTSLRTTRSDHT